MKTILRTVQRDRENLPALFSIHHNEIGNQRTKLFGPHPPILRDQFLQVFEEIHALQEIESRSDACKVSALPIVLLFSPQAYRVLT